jgi:hypothetical protein
MTSRFAAILWFLALALLLAGCNRKPTGDISGMVKYQGKSLPLGMIAFLGQDGHVTRGNIEDGVYHAVKVPLGPVKVTVFANASPVPPHMVDQFQSLPPAYRRPYVPIPERYQDPDTSGLSYTVVRGPQTYDVELKEK